MEEFVSFLNRCLSHALKSESSDIRNSPQAVEDGCLLLSAVFYVPAAGRCRGLFRFGQTLKGGERYDD
ncbi:hypothetical protein C6W26_08410 [Bacillus halotolerans]|nr:hypothetical protein C6W26_08410 [Bacillus halotolerans]PRS16681.1 hypothetical protein C6W25_19335 [Bacillus halotolerans]